MMSSLQNYADECETPKCSLLDIFKSYARRSIPLGWDLPKITNIVKAKALKRNGFGAYNSVYCQTSER